MMRVRASRRPGKAASLFLRYWLPPLLWMGMLFVLSAQPDLPHAPESWQDVILKKSGHAFVYGVLAWLYLRLLRLRGELGGRVNLTRAASVGLALLYALTDEYHQTFVPGRNGNLVDVGVDGLGAWLAMGLEWWWARRRAAR